MRVCGNEGVTGMHVSGGESVRYHFLSLLMLRVCMFEA